MNLLVATDIFGFQPCLQTWLEPIRQSLPDDAAQLILVSPYAVSQSFANDDQAYQAFLQHGAMAAYVDKLQQQLQRLTQPYLALGFSAGAAALWQLAALPQPGLQRLICCYGGQIRHQPQLVPQVPVQLIWAQERHFSASALHQLLLDKPQISSELTSWEHGFANPLSAGYQPKAAARLQQWLMGGATGPFNAADYDNEAS